MITGQYVITTGAGNARAWLVERRRVVSPEWSTDPKHAKVFGISEAAIALADLSAKGIKVAIEPMGQT